MDDFSALEEATMRIDELQYELSDLEMAVQRIRELHSDEWGLGLCSHCSFRPYPCPTILALEEMASDNHSGKAP